MPPRPHVLGVADYLVASTDFVYDADPAMTRLTGVVQRSYRLDGTTDNFEIAKLPALEFEYSEAIVDQELHEIDDTQTLLNLPAGIDGRMHRFVDLDGEGLSASSPNRPAPGTTSAGSAMDTLAR